MTPIWTPSAENFTLLRRAVARFFRRKPQAAPLLRNVRWSDGAAVHSLCPLCKTEGSKQTILHMELGHSDQASENTTISLLYCDSCQVRYCMPPQSVDYEEVDRDALKFYLEQGAGIVSMLEPFSLIDVRTITTYLEIGCSFGFAMDYARRVLGWEVCGYDPGAIARAGKQFLGLPIENRFFRSGGRGVIKADLVFCSEVIEHVAEPAKFLGLVRDALQPTGLLLMTTPNGGNVTPALPLEGLLPILSPGHHVILYDAAALEFLLRQAGFEHIRVIDNGNQLRVAASIQPFSGKSAHFTPELYRRYLDLALRGCSQTNSLSDGLMYRLLKEEVNAGRYSVASQRYIELRNSIHRRYGIDTDAPADFAPASPTEVTFRQFGERHPYNLAGVWYCLGIIQLLGEERPELAAQSLSAATRFGAALRAQLRALGTDDLETAQLCREAEIARLTALARCRPDQAIQEFEVLCAGSEVDREVAAAHIDRARARLFSDLVNLGHHNLAEELVLGSDAPLDELLASENLNGVLAWGIYLLNAKSDFAGACRVFARVGDAARARPEAVGAFWLARFHLGLASRYDGESGTARAIASEILHPPANSPPVPDALRSRVSELIGS